MESDQSFPAKTFRGGETYNCFINLLLFLLTGGEAHSPHFVRKPRPPCPGSAPHSRNDPSRCRPRLCRSWRQCVLHFMFTSLLAWLFDCNSDLTPTPPNGNIFLCCFTTPKIKRPAMFSLSSNAQGKEIYNFLSVINC